MAEQDESEENPPRQIKLMQRMVDLSVQRTDLAEQRTRLAEDRTRYSVDRSEMSAERSYLAAERTLSVWVRTALGLMVFGLAIDRFGLMLQRTPADTKLLSANTLSFVGGTALVAFGVLMVVTTGLRFMSYAKTYRRTHTVPYHHGPFLAPLFALLVAIFGTALLLLLIFLAG